MAIVKRETDYALRSMLRLAETDDFLSVNALAEDVEVPESFLRKIMQRLNQAGFVESRQGPFGGYRLAAPAEDVSLLDIIETVQGPLVMNECFAEPDICSRTEFCPVRVRLAELQVELNAELAGIRLTDVLEPAGKRGKARR